MCNHETFQDSLQIKVKFSNEQESAIMIYCLSGNKFMNFWPESASFIEITMVNVDYLQTA